MVSLINPFSLEVEARHPSAIQSVVVKGKKLTTGTYAYEPNTRFIITDFISRKRPLFIPTKSALVRSANAYMKKEVKLRITGAQRTPFTGSQKIGMVEDMKSRYDDCKREITFDDFFESCKNFEHNSKESLLTVLFFSLKNIEENTIGESAVETLRIYKQRVNNIFSGLVNRLLADWLISFTAYKRGRPIDHLVQDSIVSNDDGRDMREETVGLISAYKRRQKIPTQEQMELYKNPDELQ